MSVTNIEVLPFYNDSYAFGYSAVVEDQTRLLSFYWNERCQCWYMDVRQEDNTPIVLGVRLVANYPIAADYSLQNFGLTGYWLIIPSGDTNPQSIFTDYRNLAEKYILSYIYITE